MCQPMPKNGVRAKVEFPSKPCRIPGGFCQRKLLQVTAGEIGRFSMRAATGRGSIPRVYCHRSTHYVHCTLCMPARYE
jgi:hypothetical protein